MFMHRTFRVVLMLSLLLGVAARALAAGEAGESWYVVQVGGKKAGYMHEAVTEARGRITTRSSMIINIKRDRANIELAMSSEFVETTDHKPVSMRSERKIGAQPEVVTYEFLGDVVKVTRGTGKQKTSEDKPKVDGLIVTPLAAEKAMIKALADGAKTLEIRKLDPSLGLDPLTVTYTFGDTAPVEAMGKDVPATTVTSTIDKFPGVTSTEMIDAQGRAVRSTMKLGSLEFVMLLADRDLALSPGEPPELLNSTFITPDKPIKQPRQTIKAIYLVKREGDALADLPSVGGQSAVRVDANTVRVSIDATIGRPPIGTEATDPALLAPSPMINSADAEVMKLAQAAIGEDLKDKPASVRAMALRRAVNSIIRKKTLDVGFASAAEVARTKAGDCTEHAVLLCAMVRSQKIPARVVSGLIYVDPPAPDAASGSKPDASGVFGYHMWTQALVESGEKGKTTLEWVDLDAVLPPGVPTDATHIALVASTLSGESFSNDLVKLAPLIGTLAITVERSEIGARIGQ